MSAALLLDSDRHRVTHFARESRFVVVTFDHWMSGKRGFAAGQGGGLYEQRGWSQIHVATAHNDWFMGERTEALFDVVRAACAGYERVLTCGSSMAGYAALLFAGPIGAERAIAVSPQFSVDPAKVPWEDRWADDRRGLDFGADRLVPGASAAQATVLYDPWHAQDAKHVARLRALFPGWTYVSLAGAGHPSFLAFQDVHVAARVVAQLIEASIAPGEIVALFKRVRRRSVSYWSSLAERAVRRPAVVRAAIRHCIEAAEVPPPLLFKLALAASRSGDDRQGIALFERAIAGAPNPPPWWAQRLREARARCAAQSGDQAVGRKPSTDR